MSVGKTLTWDTLIMNIMKEAHYTQLVNHQLWIEYKAAVFCHDNNDMALYKSRQPHISTDLTDDAKSR